MYVYVSTVSIYCISFVLRIEYNYGHICCPGYSGAILNAAIGVDVFFTMRVLYMILLSVGKRRNLLFDNFGSTNSITSITHKVPVIIVFNSGLKDYNLKLVVQFNEIMISH